MTPTLSPLTAEAADPRLSEAPALVSLASMAPGGMGRVKEVLADPDDAIRLKSLGICIGRRVQLVKGGDPLIVRVLGARVGLSARLAAGVSVQVI